MFLAAARVAGTVLPVFLMTHLLHFKPGWSPVWQLSVACICVFYLSTSGAAPPAREHGDSRAQFVELDGEIQAIKEEILEINQDILQIEEASLYPYGQQLVVLVSVANNSPLIPDSISLQLDGQAVSRHDYSDDDTAALQAGGVHRLYTGRLRKGRHRIDVSVTGKQGRRDFQQQRSYTLTKVAGRLYLELYLGPGEDDADAGLTIREWSP